MNEDALNSGSPPQASLPLAPSHPTLEAPTCEAFDQRRPPSARARVLLSYYVQSWLKSIFTQKKKAKKEKNIFSTHTKLTYPNGLDANAGISLQGCAWQTCLPAAIPQEPVTFFPP